MVPRPSKKDPLISLTPFLYEHPPLLSWNSPSNPTMTESGELARASINAFLKSYHTFASIAAVLIAPFSAAVLLSQPLVPSSHFLAAVSSRLRTLFESAGFPLGSNFFSIANLKLSQTIVTFTLTLPFTLTFLTLAKASIIKAIFHGSTAGPRIAPVYFSILRSQIFNYVVILSANATVFALLFVAFNVADVVGFSSKASSLTIFAAGAVLYSVVLANSMVVCNLAVIASALDCRRYGCFPMLEACVGIRGRVATAMALALPTNLGMAALEALFQYRVVKGYHLSRKLTSSVIYEGCTITYIYSLLMVLDFIMTCMFFKSYCNSDRRSKCEDESDHRIELRTLLMKIESQLEDIQGCK